MINELHRLSVAMQEANIRTESWHREYKPIPNVKSNAPCVHILIGDGKVSKIFSLPPNIAVGIRKYGNNQGTFPAFNLAPLYRLESPELQKEVSILFTKPENTDVEKIRSWLTKDNWSKKFLSKYQNSLVNIPQKLSERLSSAEQEFEPLTKLIEAVEPFGKEPSLLHRELERVLLQMLSEKSDVSLALQMLFYITSPEKEADYGGISVILDCEEISDELIPSISSKFTTGLNRKLLAAEKVLSMQTHGEAQKDAFGNLFTPLEEPMPTVKLSAGFDVSLRTMFKGQPCQSRYGTIENASYPISPDKRSELKDALGWIGSTEQKRKTWLKTDKNEALFSYPSVLPKADESFVAWYGDSEDQAEDFKTASQKFEKYLLETKQTDPEYSPEYIRVFILRKIDKARTKVVFSYNATPKDMAERASEWRKASENLPQFFFGSIPTPFPLKVAGILNRFWKQDGTQATDKFKPYKGYYGVELLLNGTAEQYRRDLAFLMKNSGNLAVYAGNHLNSTARHCTPDFIKDLKGTIALTGILLSLQDIRKEHYMAEYPYLLGQMLKASDGLHELYCMKVREGNIPPQLVGSSMYISATEAPCQTISQLASRINPYLIWARTHRTEYFETTYKTKDGEEKTVKSLTAGYYLSVYETLAKQLLPVLTPSVRFNDYEKAQLFLGYLASFAKTTEKENKSNQ